MSLNFKYTTRFACQGSVVDKESDTGKNIALAAKGLVELNPLRKLAPSKEEIASNPDLSYIVFNGAVSSLVNLNHDCIDNETAAKISKSFVNKFIDIEHSRSQCVGVITNSGFSTFKDNQLVTADSLAGNNEPHNMAFCGVIWKFVDSYLHDMLEEAADSESYLYRKISASWELGFNEYCIARGSRNLNQAQIIKDEKEIERLSKYLVCNGGSGFDDTNTEVYRLICGEVVPLGMGLVRKPAASVNGVLPIESDDEDENESEDDSEDDKEEEEDEEEENYETEAAEKCNDDCDCGCTNCDKSYAKIDEIQNINEKLDDFTQILAKTQNAISQINKNIVNQRKIMKFNDIDSLLDNLEIAEASAVTRDSIRQFFAATVDQAGAQFSAITQEKEAKENELAVALDQFNETKTKLDALTQELAALKDEAEKNHKLNVFNDRVNSLAEAYVINDNVRKVLAKQIKDLDDEAYASWLDEDAKVVLAAFAKKPEPTNQDKISPEKILDEAKAHVTFVPNADSGDVKDKSTRTPWVLGEHFSFQK